MYQKTSSLSNNLVLIVDDEVLLRRFLRRLLETAGYLVEETEDGKQGVEAFKQLKPDVVIMDIMMPDISGFEACARIRSLPEGKRTPVLMVTASEDADSVNAAFEVGATDFITKPVHDAILLQRVRYLIEARQAEKALLQARDELETRVRERTLALVEANGRLRSEIYERKQIEAKMLAAQKLADLGTLTAGIAHEINSPLQVITGMSQSLINRLDADRLDDERLRRNLTTINRNAWRCAEIVRTLRTYAHASPETMQPHNLEDLIHDVLVLMEHQLTSWSNITVSVDLMPEMPEFWCAKNQITQLLINLINNARDAMTKGGQITIKASYVYQPKSFILQIADTGSGISESIRDRIFDPFFTTKAVTEGVGLGLSLVSGVVRAHSGEITLETSSDNGTQFTLTFPELTSDAVPVARGGRFDESG